MQMNNQVNLTGNLTRDIELKKSKGGKSFARFMLAINRSFKDRDKGADFIPVVIWDKQAENAAKYLSKGSKVTIFGYLRGNFFEKTVNGEAKTRLDVEVIANSIQFYSWPKESASEVAVGANGGRKG